MLAGTASVFGYDSDHFCPQGKDKDVCNPLDIFSISPGVLSLNSFEQIEMHG